MPLKSLFSLIKGAFMSRLRGSLMKPIELGKKEANLPGRKLALCQLGRMIITFWHNRHCLS